MKTTLSALGSLGVLSLSLAFGSAPAQAAPKDAQKPTIKRTVITTERMNYPRPRRGAASLRSTPTPPPVRHGWSPTPLLDIPRIEKVDPGPFAVWQERYFERGDTPVPASIHTF